MINKIKFRLIYSLVFLLIFSVSNSLYSFEHPLRARPISIAVERGEDIFVLKGDGVFKYDKNGKLVAKINKRVTHLDLDLNDNLAYSQEVKIINGELFLNNYELDKEEVLEYAKYLKSPPDLIEIARKLFYPEKITMGPDGLIYAIGKDNSHKRGVVGIIDPNDGHTIAVYKLGTDNEREKMYPTGIEVNENGEIYVVDYATNFIYHLDKNGKLINKWGGFGKKKGQFKEAWGIGVDRKTGGIYVSDIFYGRKDKPLEYPQRRIQKFSRDGKYKMKWGKNKIVGIIWYPLRWDMESQLGDVVDITVDSKGDVYLLEKNRHKVSKYSGKGKLISEWGRFGNAQSEFDSPEGICLDKNDNVYVADTGNNRVQKFDSNGRFLMEIK